MILPITILYFILAHSPSLVEAQTHDNNAACQCYAVDSGDVVAYFSNHRFYDFRYLDGSTTAPANITDFSTKGTTQDYLKSSNFTADWKIQDWTKNATTDSPVALANSPQNIYVMKDDTYSSSDNTSAWSYLTLRTQRQSNFQSTAEMENTQNNIKYGTFRFRARVRGSAGACAGMFTFHDDNNEADVEILTKDNTTTIHYTNQPSVKKGDEVPGASIQVDNLPTWTEWRTHRIDWLPGITRSYIDGKLVATNKKNVPKLASFLDLNMWSDGGVWSSEMAVGGAAELQVQWVQASFNTSGNIKRAILDSHVLAKRASSCSSICTIDNTSYSGQPEVTYTAGVQKRDGVNLSYVVTGLLAPLYMFFKF